MRWVLEVGYIALSTSWKWLLGVIVVVGALVGILFGVGVIGGASSNEPTPQVLAPTAVATTTPQPTTPQPTVTPRSTAIPSPTSLPEPTITPTAPTATPNAPSTVTMEVLAVKAENIGSLEFVLVYNTDVWELSSIQPGSLASNALLDTDVTSPGRLWAGIIDPSGITGDGPLAVLTFNLIGEANDPVPLILEAVSAYNASTLVDVLTEATPGRLTASDPISPILTFH